MVIGNREATLFVEEVVSVFELCLLLKMFHVLHIKTNFPLSDLAELFLVLLVSA